MIQLIDQFPHIVPYMSNVYPHGLYNGIKSHHKNIKYPNQNPDIVLDKFILESFGI